MQYAVHALQRLEDMTLCAAERGEPEKGKLRLQFTDIMPAQSQIMSEISSAAAMGSVKIQRPFDQRPFHLDHFGTKRGQFRGQLFKSTPIQKLHGRKTSLDY
jgi:hypothetical protein